METTTKRNSRQYAPRSHREDRLFTCGERVTRSEVSELIHSFPQALRLFLRQHPDEEFDLHQIEQVLQDCVDLIREATEAGKTSASATLENSITAFVACATVSTGSHRTIDVEESRTTPSAFPARTASAKRHAPMFGNGDEERQAKRPVRPLPQSSATMTRIDLKTDPRVFAVLDDGCNCTCHTPAFIDHTRAVLERDGKELSPFVGEARQYTGIFEVERIEHRDRANLGAQHQGTSNFGFGQGHESRHMFLEGLWSVCSPV